MDHLCGIELGVWQLEFLGGTMNGEGGLCVGELVSLGACLCKSTICC